jgi:hypothetical protein
VNRALKVANVLGTPDFESNTEILELSRSKAAGLSSAPQACTASEPAAQPASAHVCSGAPCGEIHIT